MLSNDYIAALHGDFRLGQALLERTSDPWCVAARALLGVLRSDRSILPEPSDIVSPAATDEHILARVVAASTLVRAECLSLNFDAATRWLGCAQQAAAEGSNETRLVLEIDRHWLSSFGGAKPASDPAKLEGHVRELGFAASLLDLRAASAFQLLDENPVEGLQRARRLARMARTEGIVDRELIATIALARARRKTRQPYLAIRILDLINRFSPQHFQPAIALEFTLSGGKLPAGMELGPVSALQDILRAAANGDSAEFSTLRSTLSSSAFKPPWHDEVFTLIALLDPNAPTLPAVATQWTYGYKSESPFGLRDPYDTWALPAVLVRPGLPARRVLSSGLPLIADQLPRVTTGADSTGIVAAALSAVALAGEHGVPMSTLFDGSDGRKAEPKSDSAVRVMVHRMRKALGDAGALERGDDRLRLIPNNSFWVPDSRCATALADRVLYEVVVAGGSVSSKKLAEQMGVPLRTLQQSLQGLATEGLCNVRKVGREVFYSVEDTTFYEPSTHRWMPDDVREP